MRGIQNFGESMTTILEDIKIALGVVPSNLGFDSELLLSINSAKSQLVQLGLDEFTLISIDQNTTWPIFDNLTIDSIVKQYMVLKTKESFDPIPSETIAKSMSSIMTILEGRISHELEEVLHYVP